MTDVRNFLLSLIGFGGAVFLTILTGSVIEYAANLTQHYGPLVRDAIGATTIALFVTSALLTVILFFSTLVAAMKTFDGETY